jgi:hypothetical protein
MKRKKKTTPTTRFIDLGGSVRKWGLDQQIKPTDPDTWRRVFGDIGDVGDEGSGSSSTSRRRSSTGSCAGGRRRCRRN